MNKKKERIATIILLLSLVLVTVGISYAFFKYVGMGSTENTIQTGTLTFVYDEQNKQGNGITLNNALPMSDETGKVLKGDNNVFDFQVLASTVGETISYEVFGEKLTTSNLPENLVKVYLTSLSGEIETPIETTLNGKSVITYYDLVDTTVKDQVGKTLYQETIPSGSANYSKQFRLRMWLSEEANTSTDGTWDYNNKTFSMKVNVVANGESFIPPVTELKLNEPEIIEGMIPVTYNETTKNWVKANTSETWYDYDKQMWANAVTVSEANRASYMSANSGTVIPMSDIQTMWVWIPRYEYQYSNLGDQYAGGTKSLPGEIKVNFVSQRTVVPTDVDHYKIHPAFTFDGKELGGFWYGKFETSSSNPATGTNYGGGNTTNLNPMIKPNVTSWRYINVANLFTVGQKLTASDNIYGLSPTADSHVSLNDEWGAVAYLSQSKYGKYGNPNYSGANKEVYINNYGEVTNYSSLTGCSAGSPSASRSEVCSYAYHVNLSGTGASTSGTIYGVYDMNGGANEYVMGNLDHTISSSGFTTLPDSKYYNLYTSSTVDTACNGGVCYGHALSETSGWYGDIHVMVGASSPWFRRGGYFNDGASAGVFVYDGYAGYTGSAHSFRLALVP